MWPRSLPSTTKVSIWPIDIFKASSREILTILFLSTGGIYEYKSDNRGIPMFRINKITGNLQGLKSGEWTDIIREVR